MLMNFEVVFIRINTAVLPIRNLKKDADLGLSSNPINPETKDLYTRCKDGRLLW